ncbi:MAG: SRPBCC family protein [Bacteroidetes bacterium]|jgi:carbon monoxide dehydrogenase subunit G|nr:SRPBCC family protein [Bacteroidota bacterium]
MVRIESDEIVVRNPDAKVFEFLSDCNNLQQLMPEQVTDWQSTTDECSFTIKGMASLGMEVAERNANSQIKIVRKGKAPFDFNMFYNLVPDGEGQTRLQIVFDADMNPFLKMMAEKPLKNFLNTLAENYRKLTDSPPVA